MLQQFAAVTSYLFRLFLEGLLAGALSGVYLPHAGSLVLVLNATSLFPFYTKCFYADILDDNYRY